MKTIVLVLILIPLINIQAQISIKSEYLTSSKFKDEDGSEIGGKGDLKTIDANIRIPVSVKMNENNRPTAWAIGLGGTYAAIGTKNLSKDYYISEILNTQIGLMHLQPLNDKWSILATLGVGLYTSDLKRISGKHLLGQGGVLFIRHAKPNFDWGIGAAVNNALGYPMIFPSFYLDWKLEGKYELVFSMYDSFELGVSTLIADNFKVALVGEMKGLMAAVEKDGKSMYFINQYGYLGIRPELIISKSFSIPITCGISFSREAYFQSKTLKALFENNEKYPHFGVSAYLSIGLKYGF
ncbi:MAG: DUF6268 family outer membrane beta-barrel protein [Dysgonomonas sp.]|nr:DUF6268 family outer membrane beta-barrel protein [Dysgonomonas sp.]